MERLLYFLFSIGTLQYYNFTAISKVITMLIFFFVAVFCLYHEKMNVPKNIKFDLFFGGGLFFYNLVTVLWGHTGLFTFVITLQFPILYFLLALSSHYISSRILIDFHSLVARSTLVIFLSWLSFSVFGFLFLNESLWIDDLGVKRMNGALGISGSSILNVFVFISSIYLSVFRKKKYFYILVIASFLCVYLSGTRSSLFACLFSLVIFVLCGSLKWKTYYFILSLPLVGFFVWNKVLKRLFFDGSQLGSLDEVNFNGRMLLWESLFNNIENPWLGNGVGSSIELLQTIAIGVGIQPHCDYIRLYHDTGLVGLSLFFVLLLTMILKIIYKIMARFDSNEVNDLSFILSLIAAFMIIMITDNVYIYTFFFFPLLIYYFIVNSRVE